MNGAFFRSMLSTADSLADCGETKFVGLSFLKAGVLLLSMRSASSFGFWFWLPGLSKTSFGLISSLFSSLTSIAERTSKSAMSALGRDVALMFEVERIVSDWNESFSYCSWLRICFIPTAMSTVSRLTVSSKLFLDKFFSVMLWPILSLFGLI